MTPLRWCLCLPVLLALPALAADPGENPGHYAEVKLLEGAATIRKGDAEAALARGVPVAEGDLVETRGRGILQLGDGSRVAFNSGARFQVAELYADAQGLREALFRLDHGRLRIRMGAQSGARIRVDAPAGSGTLDGRADATFEAGGDGSLEQRVHAGRATFANGAGGAEVKAGERLLVAGGQDRPGRLTRFNAREPDDFDAWCGPLLTPPGSPGAARVPAEIRYYADELDGRGNWILVPECGLWCWRPAGLAVDWRPYWDGGWACSPGGLTWIAAEPWGFVTHHFGRWGWEAGIGWYWIPGNVYSPAWVVWQCSGTSLGWAPLGFRDRPAAWGYGPWRGGCAWNIVNINFINAGNVRSRTFVSAELVGAFNRPGASYQGRMVVTAAEFRNPAQVQRLAGQPDLLRERTEAYARTARTQPQLPPPAAPRPVAARAPAAPGGERPRQAEAPAPARPAGHFTPPLERAPQSEPRTPEHRAPEHRAPEAHPGAKAEAYTVTKGDTHPEGMAGRTNEPRQR